MHRLRHMPTDQGVAREALSKRSAYSMKLEVFKRRCSSSTLGRRQIGGTEKSLRRCHDNLGKAGSHEEHLTAMHGGTPEPLARMEAGSYYATLYYSNLIDKVMLETVFSPPHSE